MSLVCAAVMDVPVQGKGMGTPFFRIQVNDGRARFGMYAVGRKEVKTPAFFPVMALYCGGNSTNLFAGGIFKHIKSHIKENPDDFDCIMTSAVQFLDFHYDQKRLEKALSQPIQDWLGYNGMLFVDSGGYKLISGEYSKSQILSGYGSLKISMTPDNILDMQSKMNADIAATLDFPLGHGISADEKKRRIDASIINSRVAIGRKPDDMGIFAAVHGHTPEEVRHFVRSLADGFDGYAVGSLVPLKNNYETLIRIVHAARSEVPVDKPMHLFGVTGRLLPLLAYMGVDSFDSATYMHAGRFGRYLDPRTRRGRDISKISRRVCRCPICSNHRLSEMKGSKSRSAALVSLHNYYVLKNETRELQHAIESGELDSYLTRYCENDRRLTEALKLVKNLCKPVSKEG